MASPRAYGDFMGVVLAAGERRVELQFAPDDYARARAITLAGLGVVAAVALYGWRGARRASAAMNPP